MQSQAAPVPRRQEWRDDTFRDGGPQLEIGVVKAVVQPGLVDVGEIAEQQLGIDRATSRYGSGETIAIGAALVAVLVDRDLRVPNQLQEERRVDAAMAVGVPVMVEHSLPRDHRGEMRRLQRRDLPLLAREIGNAEQSHLAIRPGLDSGPFDGVIVLPRLQWRHY